MRSMMPVPFMCVAELSQAARRAARKRSIILVAECEAQWVCTIQPVAQKGWGLDGVWSEDFHHTTRVAATGRSEGYYTDYRGTPQELMSCIKRAFSIKASDISGRANLGEPSSRASPPKVRLLHSKP